MVHGCMVLQEPCSLQLHGLRMVHGCIVLQEPCTLQLHGLRMVFGCIVLQEPCTLRTGRAGCFLQIMLLVLLPVSTCP